MNLLRNELMQFNKYAEIKKRTQTDWINIYLRRYTIIFLNIISLGLAIWAVYWLTMNPRFFPDLIDRSNLPNSVKENSSIIPNLLITVVISLTPYIIRFSTGLE